MKGALGFVMIMKLPQPAGISAR